MDDDVVGRVQALALETSRRHRRRATGLVRTTPAAMLAGQLTTFVVERVAVAVAGWIAKHRHPSIVVNPPHLHVVGDVAPDQYADAVHATPSAHNVEAAAGESPCCRRCSSGSACRARRCRDPAAPARASPNRVHWRRRRRAWVDGRVLRCQRRPRPRRAWRSGTSADSRGRGDGEVFAVRMRVWHAAP